MNSLQELYPEAYEKPYYSIKEIMSRASISRKIFDRYKNRFSTFFQNQGMRENRNGRMLYRPEILILSHKISEQLQKGLKHADIEEGISKEFNLDKIEKDHGNDLLKSGESSSNKESNIDRKNGETPGENLKNEEYFELVKENLTLKGNVEVLKEKLNGKDQVLYEREKVVELLQKEVQLLEAPKKLAETTLAEKEKQIEQYEKQVDELSSKNILFKRLSWSFIVLNIVAVSIAGYLLMEKGTLPFFQ